MVNIRNLIDAVKCFQTVRDLRWPQGVTCPHCTSGRITKQGHDTTQPARQRYRCQACQKLFDDLTGTIFAGHHQPLRVWLLCLYFMGLNLSNEQIGRELDLDLGMIQRAGTVVNAVAPGVIKTPMHAAQTHEFLAGLQPMGRMGEIQEVVDAVLYLEGAAFVTGEILHVDGGAHAGRW